MMTDSSEEVYEVEQILDRRSVRGRVQYLVKWRHYDHEDNSWELGADLVRWQNKVDKFERENPMASAGPRTARMNERIMYNKIPRSFSGRRGSRSVNRNAANIPYLRSPPDVSTDGTTGLADQSGTSFLINQPKAELTDGERPYKNFEIIRDLVQYREDIKVIGRVQLEEAGYFVVDIAGSRKLVPKDVAIRALPIKVIQFMNRWDQKLMEEKYSVESAEGNVQINIANGLDTTTATSN